ncbi:hypothetical protein NM208_g10430 [Fusarium decemcellulare]|uniref:Uncharacterized protein n=1 Tax=Fusarium decemcellulare TaxID=57161 RepID=A0ACC1RY44_9HYPO|nr:hypothetical protein NM208_g10430 [Fusarium decemcellulare]
MGDQRHVGHAVRAASTPSWHKVRLMAEFSDALDCAMGFANLRVDSQGWIPHIRIPTYLQYRDSAPSSFKVQALGNSGTCPVISRLRLPSQRQPDLQPIRSRPKDPRNRHPAARSVAPPSVMKPVPHTSGVSSAPTQTIYSPYPSPSYQPNSPYTFYAGPQNPAYIWYPPVMDAATSIHNAPSNGVRDDGFSGPEDFASSSTSPNSQALGFDGRGSPSASPSATTEARVNIPSVPAACLACRGKHLKCDGQNPCSRCTSSNSECIYVASRRGYKGPRRGTARNPNKRHASSPARESNSSADGPASLAPATSVTMGSISCLNPALADDMSNSSFPASLLDPALTSNGNGNNDLSLFRPYGATDGAVLEASDMALSQHQGPVPAQVPVPTPAERCLDSFYRHFHAAHPFVLPKEYLLRIAKETAVEPLLAAIRWIGSIYVDSCPHRANFFQEARRLAYEPNRPKDGFLVQALLLLLIGLDGQGHQEKAREILADAERVAVQIGLNTRPFATLHGRGMPVMEESWRRTWWDLYVVDGMIAGVHRSTNFLLFDLPAEVALPCEEYQFLAGDIPQPMYLEDMEDSDFSGEDREFSSFAYRIQCARNLGKFMRVPPIFGPEDENLARIETLLTNWRLHLPDSKKDALYKDGRLDEMMFQAHMMTHATSILLHQPHSQLDSSPTRPVNSCAPHAPVPSGDSFNAHTKHTIQSASEISNLITHRVPLLSHTHFFTCVVTLSSIVHLSKWALFYVPHDDDNLRQLIRLNIGALTKMSLVWGNAERAGRQVKGVAQEIYRAKKQQQLAPQYWLGLSQEEVMNSIATDDSIINEIENMQSMPGLSGMIG